MIDKCYVIVVEHKGEELFYKEIVDNVDEPYIDLVGIRSKALHFTNKLVAELICSGLEDKFGFNAHVEDFYKVKI